MRILNLDGHYFVNAFRKLGHEVLWLGPFSGCDLQLTHTLSLSDLLNVLAQRDFRPELIVWADICRPPSVLGFENLPAITIGYSIDQYCNPWHTPFSAAFDVMMLAQKDYLPGFREANIGNDLQWQPLFCNPLKDKDLGLERDIPASFVGTVTGSINRERKIFLDHFKRVYPLFVTQGNYVPVYNRSRIVLNQSAAGELNFRIFEAMACGAAMLTEDTSNGLREMFIEGEDILLYPRGNPAAAAEIARTALADPERLARIAAQGRRKVLSTHSSTVRARHILNCAKDVAASGPTWRRRHPETARKTLGNAYLMLALDTEFGLTLEQREFYAAIGQKMINQSKR
ncbi:glycosyltransferase [Pseudodesulfovibrio cashew]|uniref:Glycosyltransferase n=1 Tax=Pseudodesulfovibrio cashew TaxID=2678688 RepID=A0A6I6JMB3_9BACT|nr:glycosyltransferase [Pseudodesulfovibrio cashew]QGY41333.1 glycosyltransferase [Pseudodesulfovibrio cashew]